MYELEGTWVGEGVGTGLFNNNFEIDAYKIVMKFERINNNCYKFTRTYFFLDGTIIYGPIDNLIDTNGKNNFIFGDYYGVGVDQISFDSENMEYNNNINSTIAGYSESLNLVQNLKKQV